MKEYYTDLTFDQLTEKLGSVGLSLCWDANQEWISVGKREFANPMLWFNPRMKEKDYNGSVTVKSINIGLFSKDEVHTALMLVNSFLLTDLGKRKVDLSDKI